MTSPASGQSDVLGKFGARRSGAWTLAPSNDAPGCFLTRTYQGDGGTMLLFGMDADGKNRLSVLNANWSIRPKDRLALDFRLSGRRYAKQFAVGIESDGKQGFVTAFAPKFATEFATSRFLNIDRGDVPVARLTLDGSGPAIADLKRCIAAVATKRATKAPADARAAPVPKDPFSPDLDKPSRRHR